ncbi:heat shock protein HspQ [Legionella spiritensis]|uniref:Heat shock protein HspQ n=1 Tax=Legionella spiritensis TaxID=452 RepID=A0A0W0ZBD0_LEGSP|nr:heat shock protein HspQ [Legionella spiritensis]KTD66329.1 putative DNA-binding protein hemimethylated [Legionella spiritensis]SNV48664.1 putative DNA-binding protein hemimethylated [Legionella spiritensis]VEG91540.1 putative DNA-binding protein hemimethylated [Legionella spiritensis]
MIKTAKFNVGEFVIHQQHGYRAIIIDVDPVFQASGHYNPQACKRPFASRNPWYRLLVDKSSHISYVEECHLARDMDTHNIENPNVSQYLIEKQGNFHRNSKCH